MGCGGTFLTQGKSSQLKPTKTMTQPTLEDILKIASFEFDDDGELIQTSLKADFIGDHEGLHNGAHYGIHYGNHEGDHVGEHYGNHVGDHVGLHDGYHVGRPNSSKITK